jgi:N-acyl-L-homoserine lactone synthetase
MRIIAVATPKNRFERRVVDEMHQLRARVFNDRLGWDVTCSCGREADEFDALKPTYVIAISDADTVIGCARLLPTIGKTMLGSVFPELLHAGALASCEWRIESSRFCVDTAQAHERGAGTLHAATLSMFAGIVEWSMLHGYSEIATATDVRFERILARARWPMCRLGEPRLINETRSVAGILSADSAAFERLRPPGYASSLSASVQKAC